MPPLTLDTVVLDVADLDRAARFWTEALGYAEEYRHSSFLSMRHPDEPQRCRIGLQPADGGPKRAGEANRVHLDLGADDLEREARRLEGLGASRVPDWPYPPGTSSFLVMRDPDGNEFCLVRRG